MSFTNSGQVEVSGSGTIIALNGAVSASIPTSSSFVFTISGTWVATLVFEGSVDGTNFFSVPAYTPLGVDVPSVIANTSLIIPVGGYSTVRVRASAFTSGTVSIVWNADTNLNVISSTANINDANGNPILLGTNTAANSLPVTLPSDQKLATSFSSKLRVDLVTSSVSLVTGSFTNYYTYSGSGFLIGYSAEFNNISIIPRMLVDGETIYTGNALSVYGGFAATANNTARLQGGSGIVVSGSNLDWSFRNPIRFTTSITLSADANGGVLLTRQLSQAIIYIVKET